MLNQRLSRLSPAPRLVAADDNPYPSWAELDAAYQAEVYRSQMEALRIYGHPVIEHPPHDGTHGKDEPAPAP